MLKEGGYEGGGAMVYYDMPGPFQPGLEEKIIDAVRALARQRFAAPFDPTKVDSCRRCRRSNRAPTFRSTEGLAVELIAAEPLVASPVAIDFGPDGRLWVAEMYDYPSGHDGNFQPGGRSPRARGSRRHGRYDTATVFLDNIPFPTGVTVWRKGVLVCAAPDILYAEDTDGTARPTS